MKNLKGFIAGVLTTVLIMAIITTAFAAPVTKTLSALFDDIKISIDGTLLDPDNITDINGKIVEPFIVDGTTYIPIRAFAGAVGYEVDWDGETATVILENNNNKSKITLIDFPEQINRNQNVTLIMQGEPNTVYNLQVQYMSGPGTAAGLGTTTSDEDGVAEWTWRVGGNTAETWDNIITVRNESGEVLYNNTFRILD